MGKNYKQHTELKEEAIRIKYPKKEIKVADD